MGRKRSGSDSDREATGDTLPPQQRACCERLHQAAIGLAKQPCRFFERGHGLRTSKGSATDPGWHFGNFDSTDPSGSARRRTAKKICQEIAEASRRTEGNMYISGLILSVSWRAANDANSKRRSSAIR